MAPQPLEARSMTRAINQTTNDKETEVPFVSSKTGRSNWCSRGSWDRDQTEDRIMGIMVMGQTWMCNHLDGLCRRIYEFASATKD